mgnify:CR=1 FL=1
MTAAPRLSPLPPIRTGHIYARGRDEMHTGLNARGDSQNQWQRGGSRGNIQIRQRPLGKGAFGALGCGVGPQRGDGLSHPALQRIYSTSVPPVYPSGPSIAPLFRGYSWASRVTPSRNTDQSEGKIDPQRDGAPGMVSACAACVTRSHNAPVNIGGQPGEGREIPVGGVGSSKAEQSSPFLVQSRSARTLLAGVPPTKQG